MPRTQYGIRVTPNARKQYGFKASAAPLLSNQKRYVVQVENKIVQHTAYPIMLPANSRRKAHLITPDLVRRKTREILVDLHQAEKGTVFPRVFDTTFSGSEKATRSSTVIDSEYRSLEASKRMKEHDGAVLGIEQVERRLEQEAVCLNTDPADRSNQVLEIGLLSTRDFVQRDAAIESSLSEPELVDRQTEQEGLLHEKFELNTVNTIVQADLVSNDAVARNNEKSTTVVDADSMQRLARPQEIQLMHRDAALRSSNVLTGHLQENEQVIFKHKDFLAERKIIEGVLGAGKLALEMLSSAAKRIEKIVPATSADPVIVNDANRLEDAIFSSVYLSHRTIQELETVEKEVSVTKRTEKIVDTRLTDSHHVERTYNTELAVLFKQEKTNRKPKVITAQRVLSEMATRLTMADAAILQPSYSAERSVLSNNALLMESNSMERSGQGIGGIIRNSEDVERVTETDAWLSEHDPVQRLSVDEAQFVQSIPVDRVAVGYAELVESSYATKTLKSGVLVEAETAERSAVEETILLERDELELYVKKKKKIWLIPARGNHWDGWSGWKKTR